MTAEAEKRLAEEHDLLNQALDRCDELSGEVISLRAALEEIRQAATDCIKDKHIAVRMDWLAARCAKALSPPAST